MSEPILVAVRRGGTVESVHRVHAVAVQDGEVVAQAGDAGLVTFFRSSAKPLQALLLVRQRPDLDDRLVAIACASHDAEPEHIEAVRDLLAAAPRPRTTSSAETRKAARPAASCGRTYPNAFIAIEDRRFRSSYRPRSHRPGARRVCRT